MKNINIYLIGTILLLSLLSIISIKSCTGEKNKFSDYLKNEKVSNDKSTLIDSVVIAHEYDKVHGYTEHYTTVLKSVNRIKIARIPLGVKIKKDSNNLAVNNIDVCDTIIHDFESKVNSLQNENDSIYMLNDIMVNIHKSDSLINNLYKVDLSNCNSNNKIITQQAKRNWIQRNSFFLGVGSGVIGTGIIIKSLQTLLSK